MIFGPSDRWYQPPDPPEPCCELGEDDHEHDCEACVAEQAEASAERKAECLWEMEREEWFA